jgi:hypothetical protein
MSLIDAKRRLDCHARGVSLVQLIVELSAGDPVTGWIEPAGGPREPFEGLLEMLATFDRLRYGEGPAAGDHADASPRKQTG